MLATRLAVQNGPFVPANKGMIVINHLAKIIVLGTVLSWVHIMKDNIKSGKG